jgi:hypothetical protein
VEVEYVNHAWGTEHTGSIVDTCGDVWKYDISENPQEQKLTVRDKIKLGTKQKATITGQQLIELKHGIQKLETAGNTKWVDSGRHYFDAGVVKMIVYVRSKKEGEGPGEAPMLIWQHGDFQGQLDGKETSDLVGQIRSLGLPESNRFDRDEIPTPKSPETKTTTTEQKQECSFIWLPNGRKVKQISVPGRTGQCFEPAR